MAKYPIVLIHGYGDKGESFKAWRDALVSRGYKTSEIHPASYVTLNNEVTIKDIAEGLDRALRNVEGLRNDEPFDAIVHSTGMLVIRAWLTSFPGRAKRLKRLIGLAPATFGSPLAAKGRSWIGAAFMEVTHAPDFMGAGDRILSALELGSRYTWDLAHADLVADRAVYSRSADTPYPFIFVGLKGYEAIRALADQPGTDGTVRWAGVGFNVRKIVLDLIDRPVSSSDPGDAGPGGRPRYDVQGWKNVDVPLVLVPNLNHGTILQDPPDDLVGTVVKALSVKNAKAYSKLSAEFGERLEEYLADAENPRWQQFIIRAVDHRGDPITDYFVELSDPEPAEGDRSAIHEFDSHVYAYQNYISYRYLYVDLNGFSKARKSKLHLRILASSGTEMVGYYGYGGARSEQIKAAGGAAANRAEWVGKVDLEIAVDDPDRSFFRPFTTTLIEIRLNREPLPRETNKVAYFHGFADADGAGTPPT